MHEYIHKMAEGYVRRFGTRDPFEIAARLDVQVLDCAFPKLKGFYRVIERNRFIFLNENLEEPVRKLVCAHELGHDALHREMAGSGMLREYVLYDMKTRPEYEANLFAASLLLSDEEVSALAGDGCDVVQAASLLQTDLNLLLIKLNDMNTRGYHYNTMYIPPSDYLTTSRDQSPKIR